MFRLESPSRQVEAAVEQVVLWRDLPHYRTPQALEASPLEQILDIDSVFYIPPSEFRQSAIRKSDLAVLKMPARQSLRLTMYR
jgi:hypothetical protein